MFAGCPFKILEKPKFVYDGKWLKMREVRFRKCDSSQEQVWESVHRRRVPQSKPDAVVVFATLHRDGKKYFILIKQYRIPMSGMCLEFPAGLIEEGETIEAAGLRELKEETGYTATKILSCTKGKQSLSPDLADESISIMMVEVDGDAPENKNLKQDLDDGEIIEVVLVECEKLLSYIEFICTEVYVDSMVYTFALGMNYAQHFR
uniref:Nudix hydrolase domain-containing protein n=1 Tax=Onchocerca volvulus TaxID=6282 RepID=A0A8R1XSA7_ONCVO